MLGMVTTIITKLRIVNATHFGPFCELSLTLFEFSDYYTTLTPLEIKAYIGKNKINLE